MLDFMADLTGEGEGDTSHEVLLLHVIHWKILSMFVPQRSLYRSIQNLQNESSGLGVRIYFLFLSWGLIIKAHTGFQRCCFCRYFTLKKKSVRHLPILNAELRFPTVIFLSASINADLILARC